MKILPPRPDLERYLKRHQLVKKWDKQKFLFENDWKHPSLHSELLEPKDLHIYSFRVDRKYRAIFVFVDDQTAEIIDLTSHYQ